MDQPTISCPNCNAPNPVKNLFCQACGKPLMVAGATIISTPSPEVIVPPLPVAPVVQEVVPNEVIPSQQIPPQTPPQPTPQPAYPPPLPPSVPSIRGLGVKVESWTEVYTDAAEKEKAVEDGFIVEMQTHPIPQTHIAPLEFSSGTASRLFHVIQSRSGTVATRIAPQGKDLSVSWTLYARQKPNWKWITILVGVVFGISLLNGLTWAADFGRFLLQFLFGSFSWILVTIIGGLVAGKVIHGDIWALFIDGPDDFEEEDLEVMAIVVQRAIDCALEKADVTDACTCECDK